MARAMGCVSDVVSTIVPRQHGHSAVNERSVWCGVVWCGVVWCGVVWCGVCGRLLVQGSQRLQNEVCVSRCVGVTCMARWSGQGVLWSGQGTGVSD
jgi:hypothetical protein